MLRDRREKDKGKEGKREMPREGREKVKVRVGKKGYNCQALGCSPL